MKYKLLVLDLDGTLTNKKKEVTEHTRRTLIEAQKRGVYPSEMWGTRSRTPAKAGEYRKRQSR